jgi:hypothetical protein
MKSILSIIGGIVIAFAIIMLMQSISMKMYPVPQGLDLNDPEVMKAYITSMPFAAFLWILAGYAIASFAGGMVATGLSKILRQSFIVAMVLMMANAANLMMIPHPVWFAIASSLIYFPFAWLGGKTVLRITKNHS